MTKRAKAARAMALATRVACDKEGDGKGGRRATVRRAMATMWATAMAMRLAGNKENKGKGGKSNGSGNVKAAGKGEDDG